MRDSIRIGGGQGYYGDGYAGVGPVLDAGVDYLVCEALAELTLAILQKDRQRDESLGYTRDLPLYVAAALPHIVEGRTRFITNAGGINPIAAGRAVVEGLRAQGVTGLTVATVVGDDLRSHADQVPLPDDTLFASVYLGARPIVEALDAGADIVITGRRRGRLALPGAARARVRLGLGRLGPTLGRHHRGAPAGVLGPGGGRELLR